MKNITKTAGQNGAQRATEQRESCNIFPIITTDHSEQADEI